MDFPSSSLKTLLNHLHLVLEIMLVQEVGAYVCSYVRLSSRTFMCTEPMKQVPQVTAFMSNKVSTRQNYHFINFSNASFIP